ncbi:MAG: glycosyltransferase family 39 protein [Desulfuromonadales bacterium]
MFKLVFDSFVSKDHSNRALLVVLGFSLIIKALMIYQVEIINPDGIRYINSAHELFRGNISAAFAHEKMLGYTFLLGLTQSLVSGWYLAGKILSSVALLMTTVPLYFIALELFGRRPAFYTALVFTVVPHINSRSGDVIKEPVSLFLMVLTVWLAMSALKKSDWRFSLAAGLVCCLSVLVRPEGIVLFLIILVFWVVDTVFSPAHRRDSLKSAAGFSALPLAGLCLICLLFVLGVLHNNLMFSVHERFSDYLQTDLFQIYSSLYDHLKSVEKSFPGGEWTNDFFELARYNIFIIYLLGMLQVFAKSLFPVFVIPLFYGLRLRNFWSRPLVLLLFVLCGFLLMDYVFLVSRNFVTGRYMIVPLTLSYVLVGHGLDRIITALENVRYSRAAILITAVLCVLWPLSNGFAKVSPQKLEIKLAGQWLRESQNLSMSRMLVTEERVAYYAGLLRTDYVTSPDSDLQSLASKAVQNDCDMIVLYRRNSNFSGLSDPKEFQFVKEFPGHKMTVKIYARRGP